MKKIKKLLIIAIVIIQLFIFTGCFPIQSDDVYETPGTSQEERHNSLRVSESQADRIKTLGLGKGVNVLSAKNATEIKLGNDIFDSTKLNDKNIMEFSTSISESGYSSGSSLEEISKSININLFRESGFNINATGVFSAGLVNSFGIGTSIKNELKNNQYYASIYHYINSETVYLETFGDEKVYMEILSKNFIDDLEEVELGNKSIDWFFNRYGTHVLMSALFGGKLEMNFSAMSSEKLSAKNIESGLKSKMSATVKSPEGITVGVSDEINIFGNVNDMKRTDTYETKFNCIALGGRTFQTSDFSKIGEGYTLWADSFNNDDQASTIIGAAKEGLVAIWDYFPEKYVLLGEEMKNKFIDLSESSSSELLKSIRPSGEIPYEVTFGGEKIIRKKTVRITDSGRFKQHYDIIKFSDIDDAIDLNKLMEEGYHTVSIHIELDVREIYNGRQYIFLFSSPSNSNKYLIDTLSFTHSEGKGKSKDWWAHTFSELKFENIPIVEFTDNRFVIRYGASGDWSDDWENKNLKIKLVFKQSIEN